MKFEQNIKETIQKRHSTRSYNPKLAVEADKINALRAAGQELNTNSFRFEIVTAKNESGENVKLGTYGVIKGASVYLVGIMNSHTKEDTVDFGRAYEYFVLKATELGLGTCWMVSTFNAESFLASMNVEANEKIVMVSPLGYEDSPTIQDRVMRLVVKSANRMDWEKLFFENTLETPLTQSSLDGKYAEVLELVRLAPSAANTQPWRIVRENENIFHFYIDTQKMYIKSKHHCGYNDMGIAKAHFELAAKANEQKGAWKNLQLPDLAGNRYEYMYSWQGE